MREVVDARGVARDGACDDRFVGPFMLFQGPLVVYSRRLATALIALPRFTEDEARVGTNWSGIVALRLASRLVPERVVVSVLQRSTTHKSSECAPSSHPRAGGSTRGDPAR